MPSTTYQLPSTVKRVALVHDYIKEYGGAERVLRVLADIYPKAPIYTAFSVKGSTAQKEYADREIRESWLAPLLKVWKLYSPLRFLIPLIWGTMDLSDYDLVITSASWYVTRGFKVGKNTKVICYCHTPPRWLYGYETSVGFTKYWPVKVYSAIVGHIIRLYDFRVSQKIKYWIANSRNVQGRIEKFYRKSSVVIYPPVDVEEIIKTTKGLKKESYYLMVSRLAGAKGLEEAAKAAKEIGFKLKIVGEAHGFAEVEKNLKKLSGGNVELLGRVDDEELYRVYGKAKGFLALAKDEDFGITPVEAMAAGTPVIAFNGGGFRESVVENETGLFINSTSTSEIAHSIRKFEKQEWDREKLIKQARKFSRERFEREIKNFVRQV
jgi:glycosyltransferase involved in cell wall biosynthesis